MNKDLFEIECAVQDVVFAEDWENITVKNIFTIDYRHIFYIHESGLVARDVDVLNQIDAVQKALLDDHMVDHVCEEVVEVTGAEIINVLMFDSKCEDFGSAEELFQYLYAQFE